MEQLGLETRIKLERFKARDFQRPLLDALLKGQSKRLLAVWPRRAWQGYLCF